MLANEFDFVGEFRERTGDTVTLVFFQPDTLNFTFCQEVFVNTFERGIDPPIGGEFDNGAGKEILPFVYPWWRGFGVTIVFPSAILAWCRC